MPIGLSHGDPCSRCPESRPGKPVLAATNHGMCSLCWLGATELQRRLAVFEFDATEATSDKHAAFELYYAQREALLNGLDALPVAGPHRAPA